MTKKPLIIFDFDGTLADSLPLALAQANELANKYRYKEVSSLNEIRDISAINYILKNIKWYKIPFWLLEMRKRLLLNAEKIELFDGIIKLLKSLNKDFDFAIVGGGDTKYHNLILNNNNCNLFTYKIGNTARNKDKAIKRIIKKLNQDVLCFIGDDLHDLQAANRINVTFIGVTWGSSSKELLETNKAKNIATTVLELETKILDIYKGSII